MTNYWNRLLPPELLPSPHRPLPLFQPEMLRRDAAANDYEAIDWKALLSGGDHPPTLDYGKSEDYCRYQAQQEIVV